MTDITLLPTRATYAPNQGISIDIERPESGLYSGEISVWRLGELVSRFPVANVSRWDGPTLPEGSYGIELTIDGELCARTAVEVTATPRGRLRYGFVASYLPQKDPIACADLARRLHLNGIQFYDWAYRHADLMGEGESYTDALDQTISLDTVRNLITAYREVGTDSIGYAAVYAAGPEEWPTWKQHALLRPTGEPYALGDFLFILDPAAPEWLAHFRAELSRTSVALGFDGYHLDQYGYPKFAATPDGTAVDVADSFATLITQVRDELPEARLIFNNVNDFPTWRTASLPQDAVYIEPWEPNLTLESLAHITQRARSASTGQPIVLAAYQHVYDSVEAQTGDHSAAFTMATLFSHGATQLLVGEGGNLLVDPYYVRNQEATEETLSFLARWYDFLVEHDEILMSSDLHEVTPSYVGDYNGDLDVTYPSAPVASNPTGGAVWRRVVSHGSDLIVHLINLAQQTDTLWDAVRAQPVAVDGGVLRMRHIPGRTPRIRVADPDGTSRLIQVPVRIDGDYAIAELPPLYIWQVLHVTY